MNSGVARNLRRRSPDPEACLRGPISKGEGEGKGREEGKRKGTEGTGLPFRKFLDPPLQCRTLRMAYKQKRNGVTSLIDSFVDSALRITKKGETICRHKRRRVPAKTSVPFQLR